jgi:hypothetical protein
MAGFERGGGSGGLRVQSDALWRGAFRFCDHWALIITSGTWHGTWNETNIFLVSNFENIYFLTQVGLSGEEGGTFRG